MGVCGCGKSSVGKLLSTHFNCNFVEGDDFHPTANIAKMRASIPLEDADRWPWLEALAGKLDTSPPVIISCSALRRRYRNLLREKAQKPPAFLCLTGSRTVLLQRLASRQGHYMPASLLDSQLAAFESPAREPNTALLSIEQPLPDIISQAIHFINYIGKVSCHKQK